MTEPGPVSDPYDAAEKMAQALDRMSERLDVVRAYGRRSRVMIIGMVVSLILDLTLTGVVTFLAYRSNNLGNTISHENVVQCQASNDARSEDIAIWSRVLALPMANTPARQQEVAELKHLVAVKDSPRDCSQVDGN